MAALVVVLAACGRVSFEGRPDGDVGEAAAREPGRVDAPDGDGSRMDAGLSETGAADAPSFDVGDVADMPAPMDAPFVDTRAVDDTRVEDTRGVEDTRVSDVAAPSDGRPTLTDAPISIDAPSNLTCADVDLGMAVGPSVYTGTTAGMRDDYTGCRGGGTPDLALHWVAPSTGDFVIDLCRSTSSFDAVLSVLDRNCTGGELACDDDGCGGSSRFSRLTLSATMGGRYVIVVDSWSGAGRFDLSIYPP